MTPSPLTGQRDIKFNCEADTFLGLQFKEVRCLIWIFLQPIMHFDGTDGEVVTKFTFDQISGKTGQQ